MGSLSIDVPDAVKISDMVSSGSESAVKCIDSEGVVQHVFVAPAATIGNSAVLYPGSRLERFSVLGNDSVLPMGKFLQEFTRQQGHMQYKMEPDKALLALMEADNNTESNESSMSMPRFFSLRCATTLWLLTPVARFLRWTCPLMLTIVVLQYSIGGAVPVYVASQGLGFVLATLWVRMLSYLSGQRSKWEAGEASVFTVASMVAHGLLSPSIYSVLSGTPFMTAAARLAGFRVGRGAVMLTRLQLESSLVSYGDESVVETGCQVEGHYLETLKFKYHPTSAGRRAWVQSGSRVMPQVVMEDCSRLLPASTILPGEVVNKGWIWGGGMPASPWLQSVA